MLTVPDQETGQPPSQVKYIMHSTRIGIVLQKLIIKDNTSNLPET